MIKKIQTYLLEHNPLLWQSKLLPMLAVGVVMWAVSFGIGYSSVSMQTLQDVLLRNYYFNFFFLVHFIVGILIYIVWALYFYRTNALWHIYPLQKFYLHILFLQIIIPMAVICSLYIPFTEGAIAKAGSLLNGRELEADKKTVNMAYPFLVNQLGEYALEQKIYPSPFPLDFLKKDEQETEWSERNIYYKPRIVNGVFDTMSAIYNPADNAEHIIRIDNSDYLFFRQHEFSQMVDSCNSINYWVIDTFIKPDSAIINSSQCVENFSNLMIADGYDMAEIYKYENGSYLNDSVYKKEFAPTVYRWVKNKSTDSIAASIEALKKVLTKYQIDFQIPTNELIFQLTKNNFRVTGSLISGYRNSTSADHYRESTTITYAIDETLNDEIGYARFDDLQQIYDNYEYMIQPRRYVEIFYAILIISLVVTLGIILLYSIELTAFLISLPVTGAYILFWGLFLLGAHDSFNGLLFLYFLVAVASAAIGYYAVTSSFSKRITSILVTMGFFALPFIVGFGCAVAYQLSEKRVVICGNYSYDHYYNPLIWHTILFYLVLFLLYLPVLKKLSAKAE